MNGVKLSRGDAVVWLLAATLLVSLYMMFWQADGHGAEAVVLVNGKRWARLDLFQNQDLDVPGPLGHSHIQVRDGQVRFVNSPCPNQLCVHTGWLSQGGEVSICLPNKVSLQILGSDPRFDAIGF
ncbi:MAG: NusG domain II-containing protein [Gammaproteobacteria bacterium]|nr:NusG domain II-containing protein [Gammaproteobacteria bacterium]MCF6259307.1 NusG domain II-containing protein [Gammaproteobacteria bacterium]